VFVVGRKCRQSRRRGRNRGATCTPGAQTGSAALRDVARAEEQRRRKSRHGLYDGQQQVEGGAHSPGSPVGLRQEVAVQTDAGVQASCRPQPLGSAGPDRSLQAHVGLLQAPAGPCNPPAGPCKAPAGPCRPPAGTWQFLAPAWPVDATMVLIERAPGGVFCSQQPLVSACCAGRGSFFWRGVINTVYSFGEWGVCVSRFVSRVPGTG
jgi:hypothetical protein